MSFNSRPRGHYIQIGRGGLRYWMSGPFREIDSGSTRAMVDSSSAGLLAELNAKRRARRRFPVAFFLWLLGCLAGIAGLSLGPLLAFVAGGGILLSLLWLSDRKRKSVLLWYDLSPEMERDYGRLLSAAKAMAACARAWHIEAGGAVLDRKYHAGASGVVTRKPTRIAPAAPPHVRTNILTLSLGVGRQTLYFFPDRLLVLGPEGFGAVSYRDLILTVHLQRFIEDGAVPPDAKVVDRTWQYVNKSGAPDRRFKNNRELPVCLYEEIHFESPTGLNEILQLSRQGPGEELARAIRQLASALPREGARASA